MINKKKGTRFPFYSHELSAETLCVNCDGQFRGTCASVQEVTSGTGQKELSIASTWICVGLYVSGDMLVAFWQPEVYCLLGVQSFTYHGFNVRTSEDKDSD